MALQLGDLNAVNKLLKSWGLITREDEAKLTILGGGVSNIVVKVSTGEGTWVVKKALPKLRVSDEWVAKPDRVLIEAACLKTIARLIGQDYVPKVLKIDAVNYAIMIEYAGDTAKVWKRELLKNVIDRSITLRVAQDIARLHNESMGDEETRTIFRDTENFLELRIDPYFITIAKRHPDISGRVKEVIRFLTDTRLALVHGDFSPKNILLLDNGRYWMIDPEPAHFGNPVFDLAFCLNHLFLKAIHLASNEVLDGARLFWDEYWSRAELGNKDELKRQTVRTLSCLMLARVDGKSPAEYLSDKDRLTVRSIAKRHITSATNDIDEIYISLSSCLR
ncbi:MAG: aminoglycoside phosphotransferase family protein [Nitrososphaerota archaeon]